jgi:hypothetical protein
MFNWARQVENMILEVLATAEDATTTYAYCLFVHGDLVYQSLRFLKSTALDILSLLATEIAFVKREKEEVILKLTTTFGMYRGTLHVLESRLSDLQCITDHWREVRDLLSLGIHVFNGIRSNLAALSEHQTGPKTACLYVLVDQQN